MNHVTFLLHSMRSSNVYVDNINDYNVSFTVPGFLKEKKSKNYNVIVIYVKSRIVPQLLNSFLSDSTYAAKCGLTQKLHIMV